MAPTVAVACRVAVLCAWLVVTSGQVCGGEVTAEDVEEILTKRLQELFRSPAEPCTCDRVEIRGSAEVKQLQPACLGFYSRTEVSWSDNPVFVNDEDDGLFLFVSDREWAVGWRDACSGDLSHSHLITVDRNPYEDEDEDEDEEKPPSSTCPSDSNDWRVHNDTDLSWNRLPLSVVCSDEPLEPPPECC